MTPLTWTTPINEVGSATRLLFGQFHAVMGGLSIKVATSAEEMNDVFRLRYRVYCLKRGYESAGDHCNEMESDEYDPHSVHLIASMGAIPVGTVRLILPGPLDFPVEKYCGLNVRDLCPNGGSVAEISRLAVSTETMPPGAKGETTISLIRALFQAHRFLNLDVKYVVAAMSRGLERRLRLCGIEFLRAGEPVDYHGIRTPCYAPVDNIAARLFPEGMKRYWPLPDAARPDIMDR